MANELANEFLEEESPYIVTHVGNSGTAREVYTLLKSTDMATAILFMEYWNYYRFTGRIHQGFVYA